MGQLGAIQATMNQPTILQELGWTASERDPGMPELLKLIRKRVAYRLDAATKHMNYERVARGKVPPEIRSVAARTIDTARM